MQFELPAFQHAYFKVRALVRKEWDLVSGNEDV